MRLAFLMVVVLLAACSYGTEEDRYLIISS